MSARTTAIARAARQRAALLLAATAPLAAAAPAAGGPEAAAGPADEPVVPYTVSGDSVPAPLAGLAGDAARGREVVVDRREGNCLICHRLPIDEPFQGEIGPALDGVGARLSEGQIRLRLIDQSRINPGTMMPPYYRVAGLTDVAAEYRGRPALSARQIEDVVAYLTTLQGGR